MVAGTHAPHTTFNGDGGGGGGVGEQLYKPLADEDNKLARLNKRRYEPSPFYCYHRLNGLWTTSITSYTSYNT
ncbi:unnamed protein product [Ceratitis capitata]|uniref:(Mediterranean fruit fly) hypothetical protein n=1 Tax=Ceratitis capitata TaxID=7213 RepID=A0A811UH33_CERCA|nr:unnamed protein product [Ceratitis capitata]